MIGLAWVRCLINFECSHLVHAWHLGIHPYISAVFQDEEAEQPLSPIWCQICL